MKDKIKTVRFGEPPPPRQSRYDWAAIARRLRRRPGEWARIYKHDRTSLSVAIRNGAIKALRPEAGFVMRTEDNTRGKPRTNTLWMMYDPSKDKENEN